MAGAPILAVVQDTNNGATQSELLRDAREPVMPARLIRKYDIDKDAKLSAEELGWNELRIQNLDVDGDGLLAVIELARIPEMEPDLALKADLTPSEGQSPMELLSARDTGHIKKGSSGTLEMQSPSNTIGFVVRSNDPIIESLKNARDTFNAIDTDSNGYLDRVEIETHPRFQRYLFDAMDADKNDRVFADEMDDYVRGFAELAATICQITLYDSGNGNFQNLDRNMDGRISIRELRTIESQLISLVNDEAGQVINPSKLPRSFRIEVQRGGPMLFGSVSDRFQVDALQPLPRSPDGPIWFQRMDRNGDGDLVWDEFLGSRAIFGQMDSDGDRLIDAKEAAQFTP